MRSCENEFNIILQYKYHHLNTPDNFQMNFEDSWIVNYGSKLRKKEDNFDKMYFESSKPTVEYHEYGSHDSNNVETKVQKPLSPQSGKIPASSKAAAAAATAAAILHRLYSRKKSI